MADLEDEILGWGFRLAAVETILIDLLASANMHTDKPIETARAYRERLRNMMAQNPVPPEADMPGYSEIASGERADAIDRLLEKVEGTVRRRVAARVQP